MDIKQRLISTLEQFEIIDCHEHLEPESFRTGTEVDVFTLFSHYTKWDLLRAGMAEAQYDGLFDHNTSLDERWSVFEPFWERIRWTCYSRAALLAAKKFYGFDDINKSNYKELSQAIKAYNTPGIYERVLKDTCNIRTALTQCGSTQLGTPLLTPVTWLEFTMASWDDIAHPPFEPEADVKTLDDYLEAKKQYVLRVKSEGAAGLKMFLKPYGEPDRKAAEEAFNRLKSGSSNHDPASQAALRDYIADRTVAFAVEEDMVIAVHTGYWGDFRTLDPLHLIPFLQRYPDARFDVYHLGYPWVRETLMLGKGFSNVWINFCWTHIISQKFATEALDEAIDLLPTNKILGFGGDYVLPVEKVYGHLVMAREDIAAVLERRIISGQMTEEQALKLAHKWLWENPIELYKLKVEA